MIDSGISKSTYLQLPIEPMKTQCYQFVSLLSNNENHDSIEFSQVLLVTPEGDGMVPPVAQLRPRNSGRDFFWRIILCARVYALGLMDRVRFRGADYSLCNTFCIKSAGSKPATQAPQITPKSFEKGICTPLSLVYRIQNREYLLFQNTFYG